MKGINDRKMMMGLLSNMNKRKNIMSDEECKEKAPVEEAAAEETLFNDAAVDDTAVVDEETREDVILKLTQAIMDAPYIKRRPYGADINGDGEVEVSGMKLEELPDAQLRELVEAFL